MIESIRLVFTGFAVLIAASGSFVAFRLLESTGNGDGRQRAIGLLGAAAILGLGIECACLIATLGVLPSPNVVGLKVQGIVSSIITAIVGSAISLGVWIQPKELTSKVRILAAAILLGVTTTVVHIRLYGAFSPYEITHHWLVLFAAVITITVITCIALVHVSTGPETSLGTGPIVRSGFSTRFPVQWKPTIAALVLGATIVGIHLLLALVSAPKEPSVIPMTISGTFLKALAFGMGLGALGIFACALFIARFARNQLDHRHTIERLRQQERLFQALFESAPFGILINDPGTLHLRANPALRRILGLAPDAPLSPKLIEALTHPGGVVLDPTQSGTQDEGVYGSAPLEERYALSTGDVVNARRTVIRVKGSHASTVTFGFLDDVTAYKRTIQRLTENEARLRVLVENATDAILILDAQGKILDHISRLRTLLGRPADELTGQDAFSLVHPDDRSQVVAKFRQLVAMPDIIHIAEIRGRYPNGSWRILEVTGRNLLHDPAVQGIVVHTRDVTEERKKDRALRANEKWLRTLLDECPVMMFVLNSNGRIVQANRMGVEQLGYQDRELICQPFTTILDPQDVSRIDQDLATAQRATGTIVTSEVRAIRKDGTSLWARNTIRALSDSNGQIFFVVAAEDISQTKQQTDRLRLSQAHFEGIVSMAADAIVSIDESHNIALFNEAAERMFGYTSQEVLGKPLSFLIPPRYRDEHTKLIHQLSEEPGYVTRRIRDTREIRGLRKSGEEFPAEASVIKLELEGQKVFTAVVRDISDRIRADRALKASEQRYRTFIEQSTEAVWRFEITTPISINQPIDEQITRLFRDSILAECNDAFARRHGGRSAEDLLGKRLSELMPPTPENIATLRAMIENGYRLSAAETVEYDHHGLQRNILNNLIGIIEDGYWVRCWGTQRDITGQRLAEAAMRRSDQALETLIAASPLAIIASDREGRVTLWNPAATKLFGWSADEMIGQRSPVLDANDLRATTAVLGEGAVLQGIEVKCHRRDGTILPVALHAAPQRGASGNIEGGVFIYEDLSERQRAREMELQLRHSERLAAAGEVAALAAHEISNPLGAISVISQVLLCTPGAILSEEARKEIRLIEEQAARASDIVHRLLQYARRQSAPKALVHMNDLVRRTTASLYQSLRSTNITLNLDLAPDLPMILGETQQLEGVLINLIVNAEHAMRPFGAGELTIRTRLRGDEVLLEVLDTGAGIPEDILPHIFDPYFTTKQSEGTGIGLSVARRAAQDHDGTITAENRPGGGAHFTLAIPVWRGEGEIVLDTSGTDPNPSEHEEVEEAPAPTTTRVLIVDDEEVYRVQISEFLRLRGYETLQTDNGFEAIEKILQKECDLAIVDIRMPELSGIALWDILGEIAPDFRSRIVFMTGDAMNPSTRDFLTQTERPVLRKPFKTSELERIVRKTSKENSLRDHA